jgi:hypothetical protein
VFTNQAHGVGIDAPGSAYMFTLRHATSVIQNTSNALSNYTPVFDGPPAALCVVVVCCVPWCCVLLVQLCLCSGTVSVACFMFVLALLLFHVGAVICLL